MCWKAEYLLLIIVSTLIDYFAALMMGNTDNKNKRKKYLFLSLLSNLGLLFAFKYFNFFSGSVYGIANHFNIFYHSPTFKLLLPVGISFYTFQTLSYTIDVYRGKQKPEKHLGIFAVYVAFFPQLVAGPIERSTHLLPQFYRKNDVDYDRISDGLKQMAWGFFKKLVIADRLAIYVNAIYNHPEKFSGAPLILATYFFAFQIYCDFSGYSDIAIGASKVMGYDLMANFNRPYFSKSIGEFWKRWHISLSTWFRDYVYIPLGGNRVVKWRWYYNLFVTFLISGLWHGANWTFVFWGVLHGFYLVFSIWTETIREKVARLFKIDKRQKIQNLIKMFITFHLVCFGWIFFRANSLKDGFMIIKKIVLIDLHQLSINVVPQMEKYNLAVAFIAIIALVLVEVIQNYTQIIFFIKQRSFFLRWSIYGSFVLVIIYFGVFMSQQFIYFQF